MCDVGRRQLCAPRARARGAAAHGPASNEALNCTVTSDLLDVVDEQQSYARGLLLLDQSHDMRAFFGERAGKPAGSRMLPRTLSRRGKGAAASCQHDWPSTGFWPVSHQLVLRTRAARGGQRTWGPTAPPGHPVLRGSDPCCTCVVGDVHRPVATCHHGTLQPNHTPWWWCTRPSFECVPAVHPNKTSANGGPACFNKIYAYFSQLGLTTGMTTKQGNAQKRWLIFS
jgi:hypothetical protein